MQLKLYLGLQLGSDYEACKRVWKIKNRPFKKKFIIIFSSIDEVRKYSIINLKNEQKIQETWPGHTTWVLKSTQICPFWLKDANGTLAVRVTKHGQMLSLIERCGPLVSTSANLSGSPPAKDYREAQKLARILWSVIYYRVKHAEN